ncbi:MAG: lactate utilization protein [Actinobacteria bacterium]|nr:lactate utilization protein [Actinomycetota bacterium]
MTSAESSAVHPNPRFAEPASDEQLEHATAALRKHGINAFIVDTAEAAKESVLGLLPPGAEVHSGASMTLDAIGVTAVIETSGEYEAVRPRLRAMDRQTQAREMRKLGGTPDFMLGSVHAVTEGGSLLIASMTGSQLGPYAMGAGKVVYVVGRQKIVRDLQEGLTRIREYSYPSEDARFRAAFGRGSAINKILIINGEIVPDRITVILVKEVIGV